MKTIYRLAIMLCLCLSATATRAQSPLYAQAQATAAIPLPSPKHEMRAVWLATIGGIDWPRSHDRQRQQAELCELLDQLQAAGINTVFFQARVRATTTYASTQEPWDISLTGTMGRSPGYDPLQLAIDECHRRGMQCHAWVVTIPIGKWNNMGCQQLRRKMPKAVVKIGDEAYLNPESAETAPYLAAICRDIVRRYDVDGLHLDYIRYPETWPRQQKRKTTITQRRAHITAIVSAIHQAVKQEKPWVMLSCSPIGKHDDLLRYSSRGWNARTAVAQDAQAWLRQGLMDALLPMMYFQGNNFFPFAIDWQQQSAGRIVASGLGIYFLDPREGKWQLEEVKRQMNVCRQLGLGHCYFRAKFLVDNVKGVMDFARQFDATPALVPPMSWAHRPAPLPPAHLQAEGNTLSWTDGTDRSAADYLLYNVYASHDFPVDTDAPSNLVATRLREKSVPLPRADMNYAVTAIDRYGQESPARQLLLNAGPVMASPTISLTDGHYVKLPPRPSTIEADYVMVETLQGQALMVCPYPNDRLNVTSLPNGVYQLRSLGRRGITHRLGFFTIKRQ